MYSIFVSLAEQDIFSELYTNDSQYISGDSSERQTPQPVSIFSILYHRTITCHVCIFYYEHNCFDQEPTHSIAEEFTRRVNEVANQSSASESVSKSNYVTKNELSPPTTCGIQPQSNAITSINNNVVKSEILPINESKNLGPDVAVEPNETPVVSAISDSPVIVPKMAMNIKQLQKSSEQNISQSVIDKSLPSNKQHKQSKSKPVVPHIEDFEKPSEVTPSVGNIANVNTIPATTSAPVAALASLPAPMTTPAPTPVPVLGPTPEPTPMPSAGLASAPAVMPVPALASVANPVPSAPAPQPQRVPRERIIKSEEKEKDKNKDKEISQEKESASVSGKPNGPTPSDGKYNLQCDAGMFISI